MSAKGFTLAELMISVAVVSVALLGTVTATVAAGSEGYGDLVKWALGAGSCGL